MTSTLTGTRQGGRHRAGRPGSVRVTVFVSVLRRNLLLSWFRPPRHRRFTPRRGFQGAPTAAPAV